MKPGATTSPSASMVPAAGSSMAPIDHDPAVADADVGHEARLRPCRRRPSRP